MELVHWDGSYLLNIPHIDEQHEQLIALVEELDKAVRENTGRLLIDSVFQELIRYTTMHFGAEERFMMEHDFPGLDSHRCIHTDFIHKLHELLARNRDDTTLSTTTLNFLSDWITTHIKGNDREYGQFIRRKCA